MPLRIKVTPSDDQGPIAEATVVAAVTDPSGKVRRFKIPDEGLGDDPSGGDGIYEDDVWGTSLPGTYKINVTATGVKHDGSPLTMTGSSTVELAAGVDSDRDGVTDQAENLLGLDPNNPADGEADLDWDRLTLAQELAAGTNWMNPDTDGGGELDGDEVKAGKDPLDPSDDAPKPSCYHPASTAFPTPSYGPDASFPRDEALENALPKTVLGYPTQRFSIVGDAAVQDFWLGAIPKILVVCTGKQDPDVTLGVAVVSGGPLNNLIVEAVKIRGVTGAQMERAYLDFEPYSLDLRPPEVRTVAGKSYRIYNNTEPIYTTSDTIYVLFTVPEGDGAASPTPYASPIATTTVFDDIVRQLP